MRAFQKCCSKVIKKDKRVSVLKTIEEIPEEENLNSTYVISSDIAEQSNKDIEMIGEYQSEDIQEIIRYPTTKYTPTVKKIVDISSESDSDEENIAINNSQQTPKRKLKNIEMISSIHKSSSRRYKLHNRIEGKQLFVSSHDFL